jgi:glycosyltransferase involved in cell wall biosynthesis
MRVAFIVVGNESRSGELTGYNVRYGGTGSSGTESSVIYAAEYLSSIGYDVTIALERCKVPSLSNGVFYTNFNFSEVNNLEYDILITCLWFKDYDKLPIKVNKALIYWCHLAWGYSYLEMINYIKENNLKLGIVSISEWAKNHNLEIYDIFKNSGFEPNHVIIPNSVPVDIIKETLSTSPKRHPHRFVHHGQWSRGGATALRAIKELNWDDAEFKAFDYIDRLNGLDKKTLFNIIASSEYFVYPQITHGKLVYKDTFSVSIAEAIGLGVIVLTYPLGAVPEYFGDYCQFLEYPPNVDIEKLNKEKLSEEPGLDYTQNIIEKINWLETNPQIKEEIREKGINYISETFNIDKIGLSWDNYLKSF